MVPIRISQQKMILNTCGVMAPFFIIEWIP